MSVSYPHSRLCCRARIVRGLRVRVRTHLDGFDITFDSPSSSSSMSPPSATATPVENADPNQTNIPSNTTLRERVSIQ